MKVNGIIAEYNPFHNGHRYQLEESRRFTGADYTIIIMSGDFVQRGAPALLDKRTRTEMALRCGADLVLELPVLYATASAEYFATGATALLDRLGVVTHLCFGSECGDVERLRKIAAFLLEEPTDYQKSLKHFLKEGFSYPQARAKGLASAAGLPDGWGEILSSPNNILGIDYIKALLRRESSIAPVTVKRLGAGYHEGLVPLSGQGVSPDSGSGAFAPSAVCGEPTPLQAAPISARAIRQALREGKMPEQLSPYMPPEALALLRAYPAGSALYQNDFSSILYYKLLTERERGYDRYFDVPESLSNRILGNLDAFTGFEAFCDLLKTRDMTHTRISRCLLHILLGIEKEHLTLGQTSNHAPYARVLGFRRSAEPLLRAVKAHSCVPLITKLADADLPAEADRLLRLDIRATALYRGLASFPTGKAPGSEFSTPLVIL